MFKCTVPAFPEHWRCEDRPRYERMVEQAEEECRAMKSLVTIFGIVIALGAICAVRNWLGF